MKLAPFHRRRSGWRMALLMSAATLVSAFSVSAATPASDDLEAGFSNPPQSARPRVWWHWMNGNVSKAGIEADLQWMSRVGIGGMQNFDAALESPTIVDKRLVYMSPDWKDAFKYTADLATKLNLELGIAASPGWSETGGPWVKPADGMKKLVWSETLIEGGKPFKGRLAQPPSATGPYQNLLPAASIFDRPGETPKVAPTFYADSAIVAIPDDRGASLPKARFSINGQSLDATAMTDGDLDTTTTVPVAIQAKSAQTLDITYDTPQTVRALTIFVKAMGSTFAPDSAQPALEASLDGTTWKELARVPLGAIPTTVSFPEVKAQYFRLVFEPTPSFDISSIWEPAPGAVSMNMFSAPPSPTIAVAEFDLSGQPKVSRVETKAGFNLTNDYYKLDSQFDEPGLDPSRVIDLTSHVKPDGSLDWTPPAGRWRVIRYGYSLTGTENHPATAEATGLEVDKYDGTAVRNYMNTYLDMYEKTVGPDLMGKAGVQAMVNDSTEVGASNWTPELIAQFQRLRGYSPIPWLPVLSGQIVGSMKASDAFLYDFRKTLSDLVSTEHYGVVADVAHQRGLTTYGEALEGSRVTLGDDMQMRRYANIPMSAMWAYSEKSGPSVAYLADMKGASSVAHIYGQNLTAAESLTAAFNPWAYSPADLQPMIDLEFASGINRPVIHTSVHQPTDDKLPGLSLMIFGQYFNRHETWAEMAKPWVDYMARNSYLLQQGRNVADVAYFYGEEAPLVALYQQQAVTDAPKHYAFDFIDAESLKSQVAVEGDELVAHGGARYRVLYLGGSTKRMTLATLQKLSDLANAGAVIVGTAPEASPSHEDDPKAFSALAGTLWAGGESTIVGKGRVINRTDIEGALASLGVKPDFAAQSPEADAHIMFVHRRMADGDLYYLSNRAGQPVKTEARFRVTGMKPELWRADAGTMMPLSYRLDGDDVVVPLDMASRDSAFVVFRHPANAAGETVTPVTYKQAMTIDGAWDASFDGLSAPKAQTLPTLASLSNSSDPAVRYFSGTTTYKKVVTLGKAITGAKSVRLNLGQIGDVATVAVNGQTVGEVWRAPYALDIGAALHAGKNTIEIKVANLWVNRLIGDAQPGATKVTWTAAPTYTADAPLRPSGLIGPVTLDTRVD
jgi:hypothetical protein